MTKRYLEETYDLKDPDGVRAHYDDWAVSYDAEIAENGYVTPRRCSQALWNAGLPAEAPILDIGCGTGLSGLALMAAGFRLIDGTDVSQGMLEQARNRSIYRHLFLGEHGAALPVSGHAALAAIGVLGRGAAPPDLLDLMVGAMQTGMLLVTSLNDHALADPGYTDKLTAMVNTGTLEKRFEEHGDHLPGIDLNSTVFVFEKS